MKEGRKTVGFPKGICSEKRDFQFETSIAWRLRFKIGFLTRFEKFRRFCFVYKLVILDSSESCVAKTDFRCRTC
jgi:hypothetical protein